MAKKRKNKQPTQDSRGENDMVDELMDPDDDSKVYLSERRLKEYTPDEIEQLFGVPKAHQRVGWYRNVGKNRDKLQFC